MGRTRGSRSHGPGRSPGISSSSSTRPTAPPHPRRASGSTAHSSALCCFAFRAPGVVGDRGRASLGRLWTLWRAGGGGLRSQTHPGPRCPPRQGSPTPGGSCSPGLSAAAAPSGPLLLPAPGERPQGRLGSGMSSGRSRHWGTGVGGGRAVVGEWGQEPALTGDL